MEKKKIEKRRKREGKIDFEMNCKIDRVRDGDG